MHAASAQSRARFHAIWSRPTRTSCSMTTKLARYFRYFSTYVCFRVLFYYFVFLLLHKCMRICRRQSSPRFARLLGHHGQHCTELVAHLLWEPLGAKIIVVSKGTTHLVWFDAAELYVFVWSDIVWCLSINTLQNWNEIRIEMLPHWYASKAARRVRAHLPRRPKELAAETLLISEFYFLYCCLVIMFWFRQKKYDKSKLYVFVWSDMVWCLSINAFQNWN